MPQRGFARGGDVPAYVLIALAHDPEGFARGLSDWDQRHGTATEVEAAARQREEAARRAEAKASGNLRSSCLRCATGNS